MRLSCLNFARAISRSLSAAALRGIRRSRVAISGAAAALALAGCTQPLDLDLRGNFGNAPSTAEAAQNVSAERPDPDARGVISYPGYQVAVAQRGDTVQSVATRIGVDGSSLAQFNGVSPGDTLREGEVLALPTRIPEAGAGAVDVTALAGNAIAEAQLGQSNAAPLDTRASGIEPIRHRVARGETAFTIARLYSVSVRSLAQWNGLDANFSVREGQFLLIPVVLPDTNTSAVQTASVTPLAPGQGSPTPLPPSASQPLPDEETVPAAQPVESNAAPDLGSDTTARASDARMIFPVQGDIIREYSKGRNDGIDIAAAPGTAVRAADTGTVAAITTDTNGIPIIVVKHDENLLTVYSNVENLGVKKGDEVRRGDKLAEIRREGTSAVHFEVREGFESVDPLLYLN